MKKSLFTLYFSLFALLLLLFAASLFIGSVNIPFGDVWQILLGDYDGKESWRFIVLESRLPQALTALFCGSSLAVSGLMLQTAFDNPLAGPSILGINSGASLGVAIVMLATGGTIAAGTFSFSGFVSVITGAMIGSMAVMTLILFFSTIVQNKFTLLIIGIMIGYITSSAISLLNFFSTAEGVHSYVIWGMGNFSGVSMNQIPWFAGLCCVGLAITLLLIKPLNAMLLGDRYAESLGINIKFTRNLLLIATGILTSITTAFCGPIAFIGLAVPHIARLLLSSNNHNQLMPTTLMTGATIALLCNIICTIPGDSGIIPLNAVTPILGAPIIIFVIIRGFNKH